MAACFHAAMLLLLHLADTLLLPALHRTAPQEFGIGTVLHFIFAAMYLLVWGMDM